MLQSELARQSWLCQSSQSIDLKLVVGSGGWKTVLEWKTGMEWILGNNDCVDVELGKGTQHLSISTKFWKVNVIYGVVYLRETERERRSYTLATVIKKLCELLLTIFFVVRQCLYPQYNPSLHCFNAWFCIEWILLITRIIIENTKINMNGKCQHGSVWYSLYKNSQKSYKV